MNAMPNSEPGPGPQAEPGERGPCGRARPMPMCPMAETCKGMMERPLSGAFLFVPAILFIALGVLIAIAPVVLVWLVAAFCILMGAMMLMLAVWMRRLGARMRRDWDTA